MGSRWKGEEKGMSERLDLVQPVICSEIWIKGRVGFLFTYLCGFFFFFFSRINRDLFSKLLI